ncbi:hypothetical protein ACFYOT_32095 [Saccharothrix saharensis]|uniref:hypothetical protein n=1 Tax=Saccharothrix saharensis TaxID=571190 RepID=UPI003689ED42
MTLSARMSSPSTTTVRGVGSGGPTTDHCWLALPLFPYILRSAPRSVRPAPSRYSPVATLRNLT